MYNPLLLSENLHKICYGNNWTDVSISDTLKNIGYKQASRKTDASANTIAALVNHLWFWNTVILQRMNGENPAIPTQNGMDVTVTSEEEWQELIKKLQSSFDELINATKNFPADKLETMVKDRTTTIGFNVLGIIEHAHYHLGQIVLLKNLTTA